MPGPALLERLDAAIRELQAIRAEVAASEFVLKNKQSVASDDAHEGLILSDPADDLLDTHAACERFGYPQDTIRKWCRTEGLGVMQGGRWMVSVPRLQRRINGK